MASDSGGIGFLVLFGLAALAYANGGCDLSRAPQAEGDGSFDFTVDDEDVDNADGLSTCDGVVVVESASRTAQVPGQTGVLGTSASAACEMRPGQGDEEAVAVLQTALAQCNGQTVAVDGQYGPQTTSAVEAVQRQAGVAGDGEYGPDTFQAMRWPATPTSGDCVASVSQVAVVDEASSPLPPTR
jgi:hypothetical protein